MNRNSWRAAVALAIICSGCASNHGSAAAFQPMPDDDYDAYVALERDRKRAWDAHDYDTAIRLLNEELPFIDKSWRIGGTTLETLQATKTRYHARVMYNIACAYSLKHDTTSALDYFEKAVKLGFADWE